MLYLESLLTLLKERLNLESPKHHPSVNRDLDENVVPGKEEDEDEEKIEKMRQDLLTRLNPNLDQSTTPQPSNPILEDVDPIGNPVNPAGGIYHSKYKLQQLSPVHPTAVVHLTTPVQPIDHVQPTTSIHPTESLLDPTQNNQADHKLHLTNPILEILTDLNSDSQKGNLLQILKQNPSILNNEDSSQQLQLQQTLKQQQQQDPLQQHQQNPSQLQQLTTLLQKQKNLQISGMEKPMVTPLTEEMKEKLRLVLGMNVGTSQQHLGLASSQLSGLGTSQGLGLGAKLGLKTGQQLGLGADHGMGLVSKLGLLSGKHSGFGANHQIGIGATGQQLGIDASQHLDPEKIKQLGIDQSPEINAELTNIQNKLGGEQLGLGANNQLTEAIRLRLGLDPQELKMKKLRKIQQVNSVENKDLDSSSQDILNKLLLSQSVNTQQTVQKPDQILSAQSANLPCHSETNPPCPEQSGLQNILLKLGIKSPEMNEPCSNRLGAGLPTDAPCTNNNVETKIHELLKEKESPATILATTSEPPNPEEVPPAIPTVEDKCKQQQFESNPDERPNPVHPVSPLLDPDNPCRLAERPAGIGLDLMKVMELKARAAESGEGMNNS